MEQHCPLPDTTHQQEAADASSVLYRLAERASEFSINLNGSIRRTLGRYPVHGGTAIVYHGTWIPHGTEVAIKTFRNALSESEADLKRLFKEVHTWSKLHHENIVPMFGISTEFNSTLSIISEWMPLGNAHNYVQNTENDPRPLLEDIASGLYYLHSHELGLVHGDLRGVNAVVSNDCRALLTDFGLSTLNISTFSMTVNPKNGISLRWTAPELLEDGRASKASDVWAFGMTILELFTRAVPFSDCSSSARVMSRIMTGKLPPRPSAEATQSRMADVWWEICTSCWGSNPSSRPTMRDIVETVKAVLHQARATSLPQRTPPVERDCYFADSTRQEPVIEVSSVLRELCNRASTYGIVLNGRLSRTSGSNPLHGGTASVYHGTLTPDCAEVAIKTFRSLGPGNEAELKRIFREVHVWSKLHHENVVRMLGISTEFDSTLSIISEWMPLGNAHTYVKNTENDPRPLIKDIASGLCYLHSYTSPPGPIVHGDLKGFNVMVSSDHRALLTDFGLSTLNISTFNMTVEPTRGYSSHWAALEILDNHPASTASDVWAFGMTILELFTRTVPFPDCRGPLQVIAMLAKRKLPHRPALESTLFRLTDAWWEICLSCWENDPSSRPTTKDIIEKVETAIFRAGPALTSPEASGSACPKSEERDSYPISENLKDRGNATATGQAPENVVLRKTSPEYPDSTTDTSQTLSITEFFTCPEAQPSLWSDLNNEFVPPTLATIDETDSVDLERNNVEEHSLSKISANTSRPAGLSPHSGSLTSQSGSISEVISQGTNTLETNTKDVNIAESTGSGESSFIGKGKGSAHTVATPAEIKGTDGETTEDSRREHPEVIPQQDSALSPTPALKGRLNAVMRAVRKPFQRRQLRFS